MQQQLESILKGQPCHAVKARIGRFSIHHGSFHTLKPNTYVNDEVKYHLDPLFDVPNYCNILCRLSMDTYDC